MGMIVDVLTMLFGGGRNVLRESVEVFRENAEAGARRGAGLQSQAIEQLAAEFAGPRRGLFDRVMDGINRLPRPALALGTLSLFVAAMVDPLWFAARMQGIALVPEPLWWLLGVIVSFYFGARHQSKQQDFQRTLAAQMAQVPMVMENLARLERMRPNSPGAANPWPDAGLELSATRPEPNPALADWQRMRADRQPPGGVATK